MYPLELSKYLEYLEYLDILEQLLNQSGFTRKRYGSGGSDFNFSPSFAQSYLPKVICPKLFAQSYLPKVICPKLNLSLMVIDVVIVVVLIFSSANIL